MRRKKALVKITHFWAVHTVHIGHTTNAISDNYTVEKRSGTHTNVKDDVETFNIQQ